MNIDEYLEVIPKQKPEDNGGFSGLCLRYSPSREKWVIGYGVMRSKKGFEKIENSFNIGYGDSPKEAIENLVKKIKDYGTRMDKTS